MNVSNWVELGLGLPTFVALYTAWRARQDARSAKQTEFGTQLAQTAFDSLEAQVRSVTAQMELHVAEAKQREIRVTELTHHLHLTNIYLQQLLLILDAHGITRPKPPVGWMPDAA